ncbi:MAG: hypothetical protein BGN88_11300 [Clostridiales bacterium 43-6]|nr:MAG: hypothetical protein BGN88_11300 [Clostridiales bacterium 43-6]
MNLFADMKLNDSEPVYLQIIRYVRIKIHIRQIVHGDELPSRRVLAATLGINPNTVQKAYKWLEDAGILSTGNNTKSVVTVNKQIEDSIQADLTEGAAADFVRYAKEINLSYKETIALITKLWDE